MSPKISASSWQLEPLVTIIIPAYNEERYISTCLLHLNKLDYPKERIEVIVVDNGSTDSTKSMAEQCGVTVLELSSGYVGAVRNYGAKAASGEVLAFLDADCLAPSAWLKDAVSILLKDQEIGLVGGSYRALPNASWIERAWAHYPDVEPRRVNVLATSGMAIRKEVFFSIGGFNEEMAAGEDYEFCRRIRKVGLLLISHPGCAVWHLGWPKTFREVYRRQVWHGSNQLQAAQSVFDKTVLSVHAFALAPLCVLFFGYWLGWSSLLTWFPMGICIVIPFLAGHRRASSLNNWRDRATRSTILWPVFLCYFVGRTVGLIKNYSYMISRGTKSLSKTWKRT